MKRRNLLVIAMLISTVPMIAGGLVTNTNQSAAWTRTLSREGTLGIDGVYYNPAGLGLLSKGLHLSISNQTVFQTRTITSDYPYLTGSPKSYEAELTAPFFPSVYAAYKLDKWAFSASFNLIGGGGSANFETGLPSFEIPVSSLVPLLQQQLAYLDQEMIAAGAPDFGYRNITGYNMDASFSGSSVYYGIQAGATYAINDLISVSLGGRYVMANNAYEGALTDITIDAPEAWGGTQTPGDYLRVVASNGLIPAETRAFLTGSAAAMDGLTADAHLNATQSGSGFTPIFGVNIHLSDMVNIGMRYEHHTKIELTNDTEVDDVGMFPDGEKVRADLPSMLAIGAELKPLPKLTASLSTNYFFDKSAYYGNTDENGEQIDNESTIDQNGFNINASLEYKFMGILGVSAGYSWANNGVNDTYQTDLTYGLQSSTVAGGVFVDVGESLTINAGFVYVMYDDYAENDSYTPVGFPSAVDFTTNYMKNTTIFAIGVDIHL